MINIVLCGGSGTRLWPLSRTLFPKQFVRLFEGQSLFQHTLLRNQSCCDQTFIITNKEHYFLALDQMQGLTTNEQRFVLEPLGRNTAPAIALACFALDPKEVVLITPADHLIQDEQAYVKAIDEGKELAEQGYMVAFGVKPTTAETGYGYIHAQGNDVLGFKEKPDQATAQSYIDQGDYYWNAGIFCCRADVYLEELKQHAPDIYNASLEAIQGQENATEIAPSEENMKYIPADSIDYAVMEHSERIKMVGCDMAWSDLGSFDSLAHQLTPDSNDNVIVHSSNQAQDPITEGAKQNLVSTSNRQIAMIDVQDLLVIDTDDALLISHKGSSQKVKQVLETIKENQPHLAKVHSIAYRPWGSYQVLVDTEQYKVKRIVVKPGGKLSLQKHYHRSEHWVVVSGTATVTLDQDEFLLRPNESTYIKMGQVHRLENKGKIDLVLVEVQVGEYTGEDDIVRMDDVYGR